MSEEQPIIGSEQPTPELTLSKLKATQQALAQQVRTGEVTDPNPENARRIKIYQDLFFNNIEDFCATTFPVLKSLFSATDWQKLVRQFFIEHQCETPHFIEISEEFLVYLTQKPESLPKPWMIELAHYEWVELAASTAFTTEVNVESFDNTELKQLVVSVPESTWPLAYSHPVHLASADNFDLPAEPTFIVVYRDKDLKVQFMATDGITVHLLNFIQGQESCTGYECLAFLLSEQVGMAVDTAQQYLNMAFTELSNRQALYFQSAD